MRDLFLYATLLTIWLSTMWGVSHNASAELTLTLALTLIWGALIAESVERGLLQRRLWVAASLNPTSRLYKLLWGGALFVLIRAIIVAPMALLLFCHLISQEWVEWLALFVITWLALIIRRQARRRLASICSPVYTEYLARRASVICAALTLVPMFILVALWSQRADLRELGINEALALAEFKASELPAPFDLISYVSHGAENAYAWCFQVMVDDLDSILNAWLKWSLIFVFVLHKSCVAFISARLISGVMTLGDFERIRARLAQIHYGVTERTDERGQPQVSARWRRNAPSPTDSDPKGSDPKGSSPKDSHPKG